MKPYMQILIFITATLTTYLVMGAGGQVQVNNPIFGEDCVATIPEGLEMVDCEYVASSPSGLQTYFVCGEISVVCNSEDGGDPGRVNRDKD